MSITINCPECDAGLKLPNRKLIGKRAKCPKCQHRFIVEDPDEVELQLAEPEAPVESETPMMGTSARWVPDAPAAAEPAFPLADPPATSASVNPFDFTASTPSSSNAVPSSSPVNGELDFAASSASQSAEPATGSATRVRRRRKNRTGPIALGIGTALFVFCMIGLWWQQQQQAELAAQQAAAEQQPKENQAWEQEKQELADSNEDAKQLSPTKGAVIPVEYMPFTPHMLIHMRPSEIWAAERSKQEFLATLGERLGSWLTSQIRDITRFEPQEIEELTFAVNFGARTSTPDVAAVVRLKSEQSASDFQLQRFKGQVRPDLKEQIYESDPYSYMLIDLQTFVVAPITLSNELAEAKSYSREPSVELLPLLEESDRQRQLTMMFDITNIDTHREYIFGEDLQDLVNQFVLWFGPDIQTASWSLHLDSDKVYMETLLRSSNESSPLKVNRHINGRFAKLPQQMYDAVRRMKPKTVGYRDMIGRFPVMLKAMILGTTTHVAPGYVRLVTLLPQKAAPNLAAASLYTWDQSLDTDFSTPAPAAPSGPRVPDKIIDRLKQMIVYVDFRNMPLQEALAYISEEIKTPIEINGDGLKAVALTQNMKQSHNLGEVPAIKAFDAIVSNPDYRNMMVMVVDEAAKKIMVTSRPEAEKSGLQIFDTKQ